MTEKEIIILIDDGDLFEGTLNQFKDCFFDNADLGMIEDWCKDNNYKFKVKVQKMTKIELNKTLRKVHPKLRVHQANGYLYFYSLDDDLSNYLMSLYTTSVYVNHFSQMSENQWTAEAKEMMKGYGT